MSKKKLREEIEGLRREVKRLREEIEKVDAVSRIVIETKPDPQPYQIIWSLPVTTTWTCRSDPNVTAYLTDRPLNTWEAGIPWWAEVS